MTTARLIAAALAISAAGALPAAAQVIATLAQRHQLQRRPSQAPVQSSMQAPAAQQGLGGGAQGRHDSGHHVAQLRRVPGRELREEDIPELLGMIGRSVRRTKLVERTYEDIQTRIDDFYVMAIDDNVVGCVALHEYPEDETAEVACLYVKQQHEGRGYGIELVHHVEKVARERGIPRVFALSNRAANFFTGKLGYDPATVEDLPEKRRVQFEASGRDSLVFTRRLAAK